MGHLSILTKAEIATLGPPIPEELADLGISRSCLHDLTLTCLSALQEPNSIRIAEMLHLPCALTEELLYHLYCEKLIEMRLQSASGSTRYAMLESGWEQIRIVQRRCGYCGPAPVSLADYSHMVSLQASLARPIPMAKVRAAFRSLVLPESLLNTLGCVINARSSLLLTGQAGTGKTAIAKRMNSALAGFIWIPYAIEIDGQIVRLFDSRRHRSLPEKENALERDRRWVQIERPLIIVGGELTVENWELEWSNTFNFYEAPVQLKSNGGTLVIDDFGRQAVDPQVLLNRWISPLERRVDFLTLRNGKKIEVPFEQLMVFSTNLEEKAFVDEAFLRRIGYRASIEPPSAYAYAEIFKRAATEKRIVPDQTSLDHLLNKYIAEQRPMKACEPRDLLNRVNDICQLRGRQVELAPELIDLAWKNYFGVTHSFESQAEQVAGSEARSVAV